MVLIYFQLCGEDYRWWWRSFLTAGSSAAYIGLYAVYYFVTKVRRCACLRAPRPRPLSLFLVFVLVLVLVLVRPSLPLHLAPSIRRRTQMHVARLASAITYFGYMSIGCSAVFMVTGVVGYSAGFWFTRKIYGSLKVD